MSYLFQIGLDFGQQYSICVYRDLYNETNTSYVYTLDNNTSCLIPNSVIYFNKKFYENNNQLNNGNLLSNIRNAVACISKDNFNFEDKCLKSFIYTINKDDSIENLSDFIMASCVFLLSRILYKIRLSIIKRFNDFNKDDDVLLVNMALPYIYCSNKKIKNNFEFLLNISLKLALNDSLLPHASISDIISYIIKCPYKSNKSCNVYPSEIASAYTIKSTTLDVYAKKYIYVIISIFNNTIISYICSYKIKKKKLTIINYVRNDFYKNLYSEYYNITNSARTPKITEIKDYINKYIRPIILNLMDDYLISTSNFILLYDNSVENIYRDIVFRDMTCYSPYCMKIDKVIFSINKLNDLKISSKNQYFINYLHAAYGVSFVYESLPEYSLHIVSIDRKTKINTLSSKNISRKTCPYCHGQNPNCLQCGGFGYTNSIPTSCSSD